MNTLETVEARLAKKIDGVESDEKKILNLNVQITQYSNSVTKLEDGLVAKRDEVHQLTMLKQEAETLTTRNDELGTEILKIHDKYDGKAWSEDGPKLANDTELAGLKRERETIVNRLKEIEKSANKIYYRR